MRDLSLRGPAGLGRRRRNGQLFGGGLGAEVGQDRGIHQLGNEVCLGAERALAHGGVELGEDAAGERLGGRPGEAVGVLGLGSALVEEIDHALDPPPLDQLGAFAGGADLGDHQVGASGVGDQPAVKGVGDGAHALAPTAGVGEDGGEVGEEKIELAFEDSAEAVFSRSA